jgi:elongation factor Tu
VISFAVIADGRKSMSSDPSFRMTIEDVFSIRGRGTVVTGKVEQGRVRVGDVLELKGTYDAREVVVSGVERSHKKVEQATAGEFIGILFKDLTGEEVSRGDELVGIMWSVKDTPFNR